MHSWQHSWRQLLAPFEPLVLHPGLGSYLARFFLTIPGLQSPTASAEGVGDWYWRGGEAENGDMTCLPRIILALYCLALAQGERRVLAARHAQPAAASAHPAAAAGGASACSAWRSHTPCLGHPSAGRELRQTVVTSVSSISTGKQAGCRQPVTAICRLHRFSKLRHGRQSTYTTASLPCVQAPSPQLACRAPRRR